MQILKLASLPVFTVLVTLTLATASFAYQLSISGCNEGDLDGFLPGSWVSAGYHFSGGQAGVPVTFNNAQVTIDVSCTHNGSSVAGEIVVPMANGPYSASGNGTYVPWTSQSSSNPIPYQGAVQAPNLCPHNPGGIMYSANGVQDDQYAVFTADVTSTSTTPVQVQFHYKVPEAKSPSKTSGSADGQLSSNSATATSASLFSGSAAYGNANNGYLITDSQGLIPPGTSIVTSSENNTTHTVTLSNNATGSTSNDTFTVIQNTDCDNVNDPNVLNANICQASITSTLSLTPDSSPMTTAPAISSVVLGGTNTDVATVPGNSVNGSPTGTVTFYACGPTAGPTSCTSKSSEVGSPVNVSPGANDTSTATSASFEPTASGWWCFAGYYSGSSNYWDWNSSKYSPSSDTSTDECFDVTSAPSSTTTTPASTGIAIGSSETDRATVTGSAAGGSPTGTVSFYVCGPTASASACTSEATPVGSAVNLTAGAGATSSATSASFTPNATGWWCFAGYYSGSSSYSGSADTSTDECFDVTSVPSRTSTVPSSSTIGIGASNTDSATVAGSAAGGSPTGTVSFYVCGPTASASPCTSEATQVGGAVSLSPGASDTSSATSAAFTPNATGWWCFAGYYSGSSSYAGSADTSSDECFDVTYLPSGTGTAAARSTISLGNSNNDTATVTGNAAGGSPSGTLSFYVCGPTAHAGPCTSQATQVGGAVTLSPGASDTSSATSAAFTPNATGWWCFAGYYSGSSSYAGSADTSIDECFDVTATGSSTVTHPASTSIEIGQSEDDSATVVGSDGAANAPFPTGTVTFYTCGENVSPCTSSAWTQLGTASTLGTGSGNTNTASSVSFTPGATGTWCFAAVYSGDSDYGTSSDTTSDECFDVTTIPTTTATSPAFVMQQNSRVAPSAKAARATRARVVRSQRTTGQVTKPRPRVRPIARTARNAKSAAATPLVSSAQDPVLGASATDTATVTGTAAGGAPTGTVTFYECGPSAVAVACTSQANQVGSPLTLTPGANDTSSATSASFTPSSVGWWCFAGYYSGSSRYGASSDATTDECFDVTQATSGTTTAPTSATIFLGSSDTDTASVTGDSAGGAPTGTVTFYECGPTAGAVACTSQVNQVGSPVSLELGMNATSSAASASVTPSATGWWCFAGYYSGDGNYTVSSDTTTDECFDVVAHPSSSTSTSPGSPSISVGGSNDDGATVTGNASYGSPTGTVTFYECGPTAAPAACTSQANQVGNPVSLTAGANDNSSAASASFTPNTTGWWCFAAYYSGDGNYTASSDTTTDECFDVTVDTSGTSTAPTSASVVLGSSDSDAASVTGNSTEGSPSGTVTFYECGPTAAPAACTSEANQVGNPASLTAGANDTSSATSASFTPNSTGWWCFAGYYSGSSVYAASSDETTDECFDVTAAGSSTVTSAKSSSIVLGSSDTDVANITGDDSVAGAPYPSGTVTFYSCGENVQPCTSGSWAQLGSPVPLGVGTNNKNVADSASIVPSSAGTWCFAAVYSGDPNYSGSSDTTSGECFTVSAASSATDTSPTDAGLVLGTSNDDVATVEGNAAGGSPTGTVTFYECGPGANPAACTSKANQVGSPVSLSAGANDTSSATSDSFTPSSTGWWCFAGYYSGDGNYQASSDTTTDECFDVTQVPSGTATASASSSLVLGTSNNDVATVTGNAAGGSPTGTVTFYECGPGANPAACTSKANQVGNPVSLSAGANDTSSATSVSFTPNATGWWCFAGYYSGDSNYSSSSDTSVDECFDVTAIASGTATSPSQSTIGQGSSNVDEVTVTGNSSGGSPTGTVTFYECGPSANPASCTSQASQVGSPVSLSAGADDTSSAASASFTPNATGWWCFAGHYSGDSNYSSSSDTSTGECFQVSSGSQVGSMASSTSTQASNTSIVIGGNDTDEVTVTGNATGGSPTGEVAFYICGPTSGPASCTSELERVGGDVNLVRGPNDTSTADSAPFTPTAMGTWCFAGYYTGDSNYLPSADTGSDECFDVKGLPSTVRSGAHRVNVILGRSNWDNGYARGNKVDGPPTGTLTFYVCGPTSQKEPCTSTADQLGPPVPLTPVNRVKSYARSVVFTPPGQGFYCFAARYSGDAHYAPGLDTSVQECDEVHGNTTVGTGGLQCDISGGQVTFNPPLSAGGTAPENASISASLSNCKTPSGSPASVTGGAVSGSFAGIDNCQTLTNSTDIQMNVTYNAQRFEGDSITFTNVSPIPLDPAGTSDNPIEFLLPTGAGGYSSDVTGSFAGATAGAGTSASFELAGTPACGTGSLSSLSILGGSLAIGS